jgi:hypothetical protein
LIPKSKPKSVVSNIHNETEFRNSALIASKIRNKTGTNFCRTLKKKVIAITPNGLVAVHLAWSLSSTAPAQLLLLLHNTDTT